MGGYQLNLDRRRMMIGLTSASCTALAACAAKPMVANIAPFFERSSLPIGLQFGLVGDDARRDIDAAFAQIAQLGFREVELSDLFGRKPAELAVAAANAGVKIASLHLPLMAMGGPAALSMMSEPARIADVMGELRAQWAIAPILMIPRTFRPTPGERMEAAIGKAIAAAGEDIWKETADVLNSRAAALKPLGVGVAYHNHNLDFAPVGETTGWDILWKRTDPALVHFEVDVGWVDLAGIDPVAFLRKSSGRVRLLHIRDIAADKPHGFDISMDSPIVGSGRLDWARILPAAYEAGARHFIVEQDTANGLSRIDGLERAVQFLSNVKV
ncbi:MAG: sugar phosphate isomerase/epimerase [Novosphingobium sp.]|nr:sugar phosphate isomerase/epimerase [Novosphingobium sp.]